MTENGSKTLIAGGIGLAAIVAAYFLPHVVSVLLLVFAGTVLGVLLDAITRIVQRLLPGGRGVGLLGMAAVVALIIAGLGLLVVPQLIEQAPELGRRLPQAWSQLRERLDEYVLLQPLLEQAGQPSQWFQGHGGVLGRATGVVSGTFDVLFNIFVVAFIGLYLAVDPERYRRLVIYAMGVRRRRQARMLAAELAHELRLWLAGRLLSMTIVGVATGLGLWLLGVPLAFTLGLLAGALSFVPYLGPLMALAPALVIAVAQSLQIAGAVLLLYAGIQLLESYVLTPLIQQRAIAIPPALLITVQLLGGVFGGMLGVLLAAPLTVVAAASMRRMYLDPPPRSGSSRATP